MTKRHHTKTLLTLALAVAGCAAEGDRALDDGADDATSAASQAATVTGMRVVGNQLQKDGAPFLARGFNMIGALTPAWCNQGTGIRARDNFGSTELTTAVNDWHANTIRLQVSQRGLEDPTRTQAERDAYLAQIRDDVLLARSFGLVVILSMHADDEYVRRALLVGAKGYLLKNAAEGELEMAVRAVARGDTWLSPAISAKVIAAYTRGEKEAPSGLDLLTPRQREVLQLIAEGRTTKAIAKPCGSSSRRSTKTITRAPPPVHRTPPSSASKG